MMKNWKTTLTGIIGAIWLVAEPIIKKGDFNIKTDWPQLVGAILIGIGGAVSHDATAKLPVTTTLIIPAKPEGAAVLPNEQ
jgi:hypothetical protein